MANRIRSRVERAKAIQGKASSPITVTAGILPVPIAELVAPETILCAAGWGLRAGMEGKINTVVRLPVLAVQPDEGGANGDAA